MIGFHHLPGHLIRRLHQISVSIFASETGGAGFDLTPVQYATLAALEEFPGIDQATLAGVIAYDRVTIGGVISRLEARGYLERTVCETDKRARTLRLTERGEALLRTIWPSVRRAQDQILEGLESEEREAFIALLEKLTEAGNARSRAPLRQVKNSDAGVGDEARTSTE
jgi:MarR family transcriptional regulator, temperature-dependent positive regulator of motility